MLFRLVPAGQVQPVKIPLTSIPSRPVLHSHFPKEEFQVELAGHLHTLLLIGLSELYVIIAPVYV